MTPFRTAFALVLALLAAPASARADAVLEWNRILLNTLPPLNPFVATRVAAITHLAIFEAVNAVTADHEPYLGTISAPPGASAEAAAGAAAHRVLVHFFPASAAALDAAKAQFLAGIQDGQQKDDGIAVGEAAATAMIASRADDGSSPPAFFLPAASGAGDWQLTPLCSPSGGVSLHWGGVAPFGMRSGSQFRAPRPPALESSRYRKSYDEVKEAGASASLSRSQHLAEVAQFYNLLFPTALWNRVARQIAEIAGGALSQNARAFALLNMSAADGLIAVIETKYHFAFWRPETAIRAGAVDGNRKTEPDPDFTPFIGTPCHPSYPSGHAAVSNAASGILRRLWGDGGHSITLDNPPASALVLHYSRLSDVTADIDNARIYGGIHFRFDQEAGTRQGQAIAKYIFRRYLRPLR